MKEIHGSFEIAHQFEQIRQVERTIAFAYGKCGRFTYSTLRTSIREARNIGERLRLLSRPGASKQSDY